MPSDSDGAVPSTAAYRDPSAAIPDRVEDLLGRMTLAEKAGLLFQPMIPMGRDGELAEGTSAWGHPSPYTLVRDRLLSNFTLLGPAADARLAAQWYNRLQQLAASTRLGIPVTLSTDPRHHFTDNVGTGSLAGAFSQWPEPIGLAALRSPELVEEFATIARAEYMAIGLRLALHPQIDLATEPRWSRIAGTFGESAELTSELVRAYIRGFQGDALGPHSVATMTKHFPGGGPQKDGEDPHFAYGREQVYPSGRFDEHLEPFRAAIAAGGSQMMPYYGLPIGTEYEEVAFGFNRGIITGLLREQLGFDGIVCTDYGLITDSFILGQPMPARAWGVEDLDELARAQRILEAGCDVFGGETRPELVVELVTTGRVSETRIDESVRRVLREKFVLGLFENPFADVEAASATVGRAEFVRAGAAAQRDSYTLLADAAGILPVRPGLRLYVDGVDAGLAGEFGEVVPDPGSADIALVRLKAPYDPRPGAFEARFHAGSLEFDDGEVLRIRTICRSAPTIVDVYLDRPAVLTPLVDAAAALLVDYGSSDAAFLDIVFGRSQPRGRLPFDLPRSMAAVEASDSDAAFSTEDPLFRFGDGMLP